MSAADRLFSNVTLLDGTGDPGRTADVAIAGDRIVRVDAADPGSTSAASTVIDGTGLTLAPGFIDVHTHDDAAVLHQHGAGAVIVAGRVQQAGVDDGEGVGEGSGHAAPPARRWARDASTAMRAATPIST